MHCGARIRIGIITDECWITSGGTEIVEVMRGMDRKAMTPGEESLPHHLEVEDWTYVNLVFVERV